MKTLPVKVNHEVNSREYLPFKSQPRTGHTREPDPTHNELKHTTTRKTDPNSVGVCFDGCEVRRCDPCMDPCALVRPRVPCVSRVCPVSVRNHTQKALHTSVPVPVKRHRGEPVREPGHFVTFGHRGRATHTYKAHTRTNGSHRRTSQPSKPNDTPVPVCVPAPPGVFLPVLYLSYGFFLLTLNSFQWEPPNPSIGRHRVRRRHRLNGLQRLPRFRPQRQQQPRQPARLWSSD